MSRRTRAAAAVSAPPAAPARNVLLVLAGLGLASLLWAGFQWQQLFVARGGGTPVCGPGSGGCTDLWDSAFASSVHALTGLPIAGWGVVWGVVALALPVWLLTGSGSARLRSSLWSAICLTAAGGLAGVFALALASAFAGKVCITCAATYALVAAYAIVCGTQLSRFLPRDLGRAAGISLALVAIAFVLVLPRGLRTPAPRASILEHLLSTPQTDPDVALRRLIASLTPPERRLMQQALEAFRAVPAVPRREPHFVIGPDPPQVLVTEFTDVRCSHCAELYRTVEEIRGAVPPGLVAFEPRQFPLDATCNPGIEFASGDPVHCEAARVLICLEGSPGYMDYAGQLYREQATLDVERLYALARPLRPEAELRACAHSVETGVRLAEDEAWAEAHEIRGTPLVLIDGRAAFAYPPFLYAMILARGNAAHPAFDAL